MSALVFLTKRSHAIMLLLPCIIFMKGRQRKHILLILVEAWNIMTGTIFYFSLHNHIFLCDSISLAHSIIIGDVGLRVNVTELQDTDSFY